MLVSYMCVCICAGCVQYNAVIYSNADKWIKQDFLKENRVKAYYVNDSYDEGVTDISDKYVYDDVSPSSRTFIINEKDEFDEVFTKFDCSVNFESEMILLYIFGDIYPSRYYELADTVLEENTLVIKYKIMRNNTDDAVMPYQRALAVKLDKLNVNKVNFIEL